MKNLTTNLQKVKHIIKAEGRFLYRKEILALAGKYNIEFVGDLRSTLADNIPKKELLIYMYQGNAGVYGLPSFVNVRGEVIKSREYKINRNYEKVNANQYGAGFTEGGRYKNGRKVRPSMRSPAGLRIVS